MTTKTYTAVASTKHNIGIYDAESGNYIKSLFVTTGEIIGQPIISAKTITVTYTEGGNNWMAVFDINSHNLIRKQSLV